MFDVNEIKLSAMNRPKGFKHSLRLLFTKSQYAKDDVSDYWIRYKVLDGVIYVMGESKVGRI